MIVCDNPIIEMYNDDCITGMGNILDKSIDMVICDLPHNRNNYEDDWNIKLPLYVLWQQYKRIIKDNGVIALFGKKLFFAELIMSNKEWFRYDLVWEKEKPVNMFFVKNQVGIIHEHIAIFYNKQPTYNLHNTHICSILKFSKDKLKQNYHPAQKPVELLKHLILTFTQEGDTVLDNCCGSGTTLVACKLTNRKGIGIEQEKKYYDIAIKRIKEYNTRLF